MSKKNDSIMTTEQEIKVYSHEDDVGSALEIHIPDQRRIRRQGEYLLETIRQGRHLQYVYSLDTLLQNILENSVQTIQAQYGAIYLCNEITGQLELHANWNTTSKKSCSYPKVRQLVEQVYEKTDPILVVQANEIQVSLDETFLPEEYPSSVITTVIATPWKKIGVLYLQRNFGQPPFPKEAIPFIQTIAKEVAPSIYGAIQVERQHVVYLDTLTLMAQAVEKRNQYSGEDTKQVAEYANLLARHMQLSPHDCRQIRLGTLLRDIGKIDISENILHKPGKLTEEEFAVLRTHPHRGVSMLEHLTTVSSILPIIRNHHERWDGNGYPDGLSGTQIPLPARIVAVSDAFHAMLVDRPYRRKLPLEQALSELEKGAGYHFDPDCVHAFLELKPYIEQVYHSHMILSKKQPTPNKNDPKQSLPSPSTLLRQITS